MDTTILWLAVGAGCIWHGAQIIWVAPLPTQLRKGWSGPEKGSGAAFGVFWLDQYAWIGVALVTVGLCIALAGVLR